MPGPFDAITIDGERLRGEAVLQYARSLHERTGETWTLAILDLFIELVGSEAPLPARTSGTTGIPKTIALQRDDLIASAQLTARTFGLQANDRALLCLPCEFIAGKMMVVRAMVLGLDLHLMDPAGSILEKLSVDDRFRFTAMVPQQLHRALTENRSRVEQQFSRILLGGGPVSDQLLDQLEGLRTDVFQSYGSTETLTHVAVRSLNAKDGGEPFRALGGISFSIDARGCLVIRTPHLSMKEHVTNDLVELIDNAHFRWLGRIDNVILSGGKKVFPEQLEARTDAVLPYPHYFIGIPHAVLGQAVTLIVEGKGDAEAIAREALEKVRAVLNEHERPRTVHVVPAFKRTTSGKIVRAPLT